MEDILGKERIRIEHFTEPLLIIEYFQESESGRSLAVLTGQSDSVSNHPLTNIQIYKQTNTITNLQINENHLLVLHKTFVINWPNM